MSPVVLTAVLTALALVVVVLTRLRLAGDKGAGRVSISPALLNVHTAVGSIAFLLWTAFLLGAPSTIGALGLLGWWVTAWAGVLILVRWLPSRGRHSSAPATDSWSEGPGLSVLAHGGLVVAALLWTVLFVIGKL